MSKAQRRKQRRLFWMLVPLLGVAGSALQWVLPWWSVVILYFFTGLLVAGAIRRPFWLGFLSLGLDWLFTALYRDVQNDSILSTRVVKLFPIPHHPLMLVALTALLGALMGAMALRSGYDLRRIFQNDEARYRP